MATYGVSVAVLPVGSLVPSSGFWVANGHGDYPPAAHTFPNLTLAGHVYDTNGLPVVGATVDLYRLSDGKKVNSTISGAEGVYAFVRGAGDPYTYFTVGYSFFNNAIQVHGVSNRGLVPM